MSGERTMRIITTFQSFTHNHLIHFCAIGGFVYLPLINKEWFGWITYFLGILAHPFYPAADVMVVGMLVARIIHRICGFGIIAIATLYFVVQLREYKKWEITRLGGELMDLYRHYFKGEHAEFGRYNPGQVLFFWVFALPCVAVASGSGLVLVFSDFFGPQAAGTALFFHDLAFYWGVMGLIFHFVAGIVIPENRPAAHAMFRTGEVPESYVKEHHSLWYHRLQLKEFEKEIREGK